MTQRLPGLARYWWRPATLLGRTPSWKGIAYLSLFWHSFGVGSSFLTELVSGERSHWPEGKFFLIRAETCVLIASSLSPAPDLPSGISPGVSVSSALGQPWGLCDDEDGCSFLSCWLSSPSSPQERIPASHIPAASSVSISATSVLPRSRPGPDMVHQLGSNQPAQRKAGPVPPFFCTLDLY